MLSGYDFFNCDFQFVLNFFPLLFLGLLKRTWQFSKESLKIRQQEAVLKKSGGAVQNIWMRDESPACTWRPGTVRATHPRDNLIQVGGHGGGGCVTANFIKTKEQHFCRTSLTLCWVTIGWLLPLPLSVRQQVPRTCYVVPAAGAQLFISSTKNKNQRVTHWSQRAHGGKRKWCHGGALFQEGFRSRRRWKDVNDSRAPPPLNVPISCLNKRNVASFCSLGWNETAPALINSIRPRPLDVDMRTNPFYRLSWISSESRFRGLHPTYFLRTGPPQRPGGGSERPIGSVWFLSTDHAPFTERRGLKPSTLSPFIQTDQS